MEKEEFRKAITFLRKKVDHAVVEPLNEVTGKQTCYSFFLSLHLLL